MYDIRDGSLMNIYVKIVGTLKPIEEWVNLGMRLAIIKQAGFEN